MSSGKLKVTLDSHEGEGYVDAYIWPKDVLKAVVVFPELQKIEIVSLHKIKPVKPAKKSGSKAVCFNSYRKSCRDSGQNQVPADHAVFSYAEDANIPEQFLRIAYHEFTERYKDSQKRYKDWPTVFHNSVKGNWFKLWWIDAGEYKLTSAGQQAEMNLNSKSKRAGNG